MPLINLECQKYDIRYVANYLRKSRTESLEDLEKHRMVLNELCKKRGYKYVEFLEIGTSDSLELRPKMSKLLKEIEDDTYDAVCVVDYDRLSRGDMGDQDRIAKTFRKSETLIVTPDKIYDLNDDIDDENGHSAGCSHSISGILYASGPTKEVIITGREEYEEYQTMVNLVKSVYDPFMVYIIYPDNSIREEIEALIPGICERRMLNGKSTAYVCTNFACREPVTSSIALKRLLINT